MDSLEALEVGRETMFVFLKMAGPLMGISLTVGIIISLFQALTQIQEMTLTFVPKLIILFASLILLMPFIMHTMSDFNNDIYERIVEVGRSNE